MSYAKSRPFTWRDGAFVTLVAAALAVADKYLPEYGPREMVWADVDLEHPEPA